MTTIPEAFAMALSHHRCGRLSEAEVLYRCILDADQNHSPSLHNLGLIALQAGQPEDAVDLIGRALALNDRAPTFHSNMGEALRATGQPEAALHHYERALALKPDYADAHYNVGIVLRGLGRPAEARDHYNRAIALRPEFVEAHNNLGIVLRDLGDAEGAAECFATAVAVEPGYAEAHHNLGLVLRDRGLVAAAVARLELAVALRPDYAAAHYSLGLTLLLTGDLARGFAETRWRWQVADFPDRMPDLPCPLWEGESLEGKAILVWTEQGLGDSLQFIRYVIPLTETGAQVLVKAPSCLAGLFQTIPGITLVEDLVLAATVDADYHVPLLCLPRLLGTTAATIPAAVPYLHPDPVRAAVWQERLAPRPGFRVGMAWRGNPGQGNDRNRSMPPALMAALAAVSGVVLVNLQKDATPEDLAVFPAGEQFFNAASGLADFQDTAALISVLDLVVTVDTAVCHLAGALATPTWVLLCTAADWRWLRDREDSPWYPSQRLFRQPEAGDWETVIAQVKAELARTR